MTLFWLNRIPCSNRLSLVYFDMQQDFVINQNKFPYILTKNGKPLWMVKGLWEFVMETVLPWELFHTCNGIQNDSIWWTHSMISSRRPVHSITSRETFFFSGKLLLLCILSSMFEMWLQYLRKYLSYLCNSFEQPWICMQPYSLLGVVICCDYDFGC